MHHAKPDAGSTPRCVCFFGLAGAVGSAQGLSVERTREFRRFGVILWSCPGPAKCAVSDLGGEECHTKKKYSCWHFRGGVHVSNFAFACSSLPSLYVRGVLGRTLGPIYPLIHDLVGSFRTSLCVLVLSLQDIRKNRGFLLMFEEYPLPQIPKDTPSLGWRHSRDACAVLEFQSGNAILAQVQGTCLG